MNNFDYRGVQNNQMAFQEKATGTWHFLQTTPAGEVQMLDGDDVRFEAFGDRRETTWSIREQRPVGN